MARSINPINPKTQKGQSIVFFALMLPLMAVFLLGILDYMVTSSRVMQGMALADLAAHAGVQEIKVQPNGAIIPDAAAPVFATEYFGYAAPKVCKLGQCLVWDEGWTAGMRGGSQCGICRHSDSQKIDQSDLAGVSGIWHYAWPAVRR